MKNLQSGHQPVKGLYLIKGLVLVMGILLIMACGQKGPPLPPLKDGNIIAPPTQLAYTLNENKMTLTWAHIVDPVNAKIPVEGFQVFLATKDLTGCEGCPFIFEPVGMVPMPDMSFYHPLKKGLHHYFRVQAIGKDDMKSRYSKTLYIDNE